MSENGVAKPEDFRRAAESRKAETQAAERVMLPESRHAVMLRRPTPMWFLFHGHLPMSLAARQSAPKHQGAAGGAAAIQTAEELAEFSSWIVELLSEVFVRPRLSLNPGAEEISPEWLPEEDVNFIIRWAVGEVATDPDQIGAGHDLAEFRRTAAGAPPAPGAGGGDLPLSAQPVAATGGDGSSD
jgi:hypothetical protein